MQTRRAELAHAARLATMGQLTATIAHEVNQPLGAILANVATADMLLSNEKASRDEIRQILADIRGDSVRASEVIKRLRTLLTRRELVREHIDIADAILEVLAIVRREARRRRVELSFMPDPNLPRVVGDRVHLQQVVLNLVLNAMDAMADTHVRARRVLIHATRRPEGDLEVAVRDFGHGIPGDGVARLFQSFYTTKEQGMGLGLSICRSIVEAHGGRIWAESSAQGATFRFTLPVDGATSARRSAGAPRESLARPAVGSERYGDEVVRASLARDAVDR